MGDFRVTLEGVGGHGCDRRAKQGDELHGCGRMDCPDCVTAEYIAKMKRLGTVYVATFHHWPANMVEHVMDAKGERCIRCGAQDMPYSDGKPSQRPLSEPCRTYATQQEVVDDYTEHNVPYGGMIRATGKRVKGSF